MRFFLYDAFGDIAGNKKGYKTMRGAQQAQRILTPLLQRKFDLMLDRVPYHTTFCSILNHPN